MRKKTIVLADDHQLVRQGFRALITTGPEFSIVAEAADGLEAVRLTEQLEPDILVTDLIMPALAGTEVVRRVHRRVPGTRIVVVTMHEKEDTMLQCLRNGAAGFVHKNASAADLLKALREVSAGRKFLSAPFSDIAITSYLRKPAEYADPYESLTPREREVLQLRVESRSTAEIAERLFISPRTVEIHRSNLMRKLRLRNQTDLIRYAISRGILSPDLGDLGDLADRARGGT